MNIGIRPEGASLLSIRVSHDNGRSYDPPSTVAVPHEQRIDPLTELQQALAGWPPCQCPRHRTAS